MSMRRALLVLGMHRSGTSAVTGAIAQLGAAAPLTLMPANACNERGFWESLRIMALNDELLASAGSAWHDWRAFDSGYASPLMDGYKTRAKQLIEDEFGAAGLFVLKDPRICRILPFWSTALGEMNIASRIVIPVRSPLEVAHSLAARDGFCLEKALLIWLRHVLDAERETRHLPRAVVAMDDFLEDWRGSIKTIGRALEIEWPRFDASAAAAVDDFLSRDLKHQIAPVDALPPVFAWTIKAYDAMLALRDNPQSRLARGALDDVGASFDAACAFMGPAFAEISARVAQVETEAAALRAERDELIRARYDLAMIVNCAQAQESGSREPKVADRLIHLKAESERVRRRLGAIQVTLAGIAAEAQCSEPRQLVSVRRN